MARILIVQNKEILGDSDVYWIKKTKGLSAVDVVSTDDEAKAGIIKNVYDAVILSSHYSKNGQEDPQEHWRGLVSLVRKLDRPRNIFVVSNDEGALETALEQGIEAYINRKSRNKFKNLWEIRRDMKGQLGITSQRYS
ncbi:hypothetical protein GOV08_02615 [Candidatus Woesearchaeota archaeon]|nr:hypothetical protein [Candidatus Woesearchaeota archaeon]